MIKFRLEELLQGRSLYWLAQESGVAYSTLHAIKKGDVQAIYVSVLYRICKALECTPGDLLVIDESSDQDTH